MIFKKKKKKDLGGIEAIFVKQYVCVCAHILCVTMIDSKGCKLDMPLLKSIKLYLFTKKCFFFFFDLL